jgi:4-amino-4-deoxy-L-arabinose transferase-like glycosyltransferase
MSPARRTLGRAALVAAAVGIVVLGAGLRFWGLGAKSLWLDETQSLFYVDRSFGEMLAAVRAHDAHPPLYYALLHLWMAGTQGAARARALSALFSTLTLVVFYDLARRLLARDGALLAALLLAVSAFQIYFAQEARNYALATFLVTVGWWFLVRLLTRQRGRAWPLWLGLALANAAALYTFYYTAFAIVAQGVLLLWHSRETRRRLLLRWAQWQVVPAGLFALYLPVVLSRAAAVQELVPGVGRGDAAGGATMTAMEFAFGPARLLWSSVPDWLPVFVGSFLLALLVPTVIVAAAAFVAVKAPTARAAARLGLCWLFLPGVCVAILPLKGHQYEAKHLAFAAPALALLAGGGWTAIRGWRRGVVVVAVLFFVCGNACVELRYLDPYLEKADWRGLVAAMAKEVKEGDAVIFNPAYARLPFQYYYKALLAERELPRVLPVDAPPAGRPFQLPDRLRGRRVWLIQAEGNVEIPNPRVIRELHVYRLLSAESCSGLVSFISARLLDTSRPSRRRAAAKPRAGP